MDAESIQAADELKNTETEMNVRWEDLEDDCNQLDPNDVKKKGRILLTEISGYPPKFTFSLTIFKDFSILCSRGCTKVSCNDLIKVETAILHCMIIWCCYIQIQSRSILEIFVVQVI